MEDEEWYHVPPSRHTFMVPIHSSGSPCHPPCNFYYYLPAYFSFPAETSTPRMTPSGQLTDEGGNLSRSSSYRPSILYCI